MYLDKYIIIAMKNKPKLIDLDDIQSFQHHSVMIDGKELPISIGDKIQFPADDPYLKTVVGIQINENGLAEYIIEWFEDGAFKQNQLSLTELKVLKDNMKQRAIIALMQKDENEDDEQKEKKTSKEKSKTKQKVDKRDSHGK